jgi:hypothetical protein
MGWIKSKNEGSPDRWGFKANLKETIEIIDPPAYVKAKVEGWSDQWRYRVRAQGQEGYWYATIKAHEFLYHAGVGMGDRVEMCTVEVDGLQYRPWYCKTEEGQEFYSHTINTEADLPAADSLKKEREIEVPKEVRRNSKKSLADIAALYRSCLSTAAMIVEHDFPQYENIDFENVRIIATNLYQEATRSGVTPHPDKVEELIELAAGGTDEDKDEEKRPDVDG